MKRLIFDHFRRWFWLLVLGGALQFMIGCSIARRPEDAFEFWVFMVALWMGAQLLSFDLQRGMARTVASLPLTAKQIGRGWWLATVLIPAIALAALLFLGAGAFYYFHPNKVFPKGRLAMASLFILPWLGTMFTAIYGTNNDVNLGNWRQRTCATFFSLLSVVMLFGGMLTLQNASKQPFKFAVFMGVGALLIVAGLVSRRAICSWPRQFPPPGSAVHTDARLIRAAGGYGGIPFLISTTFVRVFLLGVMFVALMVLITAWQGLGISRPMTITMSAGMGSFMSCWFIVIFQLIQVLRQLRFLRTLPISTTRLAAVLIAMAILPLIALGVLMAGVAWPALGTPAAITVLKSYTYILAPAALCVFIVVWRGTAIQTYILTYCTMFGFLMAPLWLRRYLFSSEISFSLTGIFVALCVLSAFLLTRRTLMQSNHAYRVVPGVHATPFGGVAWGAGR